MKWGKPSFNRFIYEGPVHENTGWITINAGDAAQMLGIDRLYKSMGIPCDDIVEISLYDLKNYDGDYVILPVNWLSMYRPGNDEICGMSPKIIPVYLGLSLSNPELTESQYAFLEKHEPIGCRDQRTMEALRSAGIDAYVGGCLAATLPRRSKEPKNGSVFFVDVPHGVLPFVPEHVRAKARIFSQELYCPPEDIPGKQSPEQWAESIINTYAEEASMLVTSRFHGAVLGLALGIPTIITLENYTYRFSWLKKYLPLYTEDNYAQINWDIGSCDFESVKRQILTVSRKRLLEAADMYADRCKLCSALESTRQIESNQTSYHQQAIAYIRTRWNPNDFFSYAIWGANNTADKIVDYIDKHYPHANLTHVFDANRQVAFRGRLSEPTDGINGRLDAFLFVTSYIASMKAPELFEKQGFPIDHAFLCQRHFIEEKDLAGRI